MTGEKAHNNVFMVCKCGETVEAEGHVDFTIHTCSECHRVGCWVNESGLWEIPNGEPVEGEG